MSIDYLHDDVTCRIFVKTGREVTFEDVLGVIDRQAAEGAWSYEMLWDARESLSIPSLDEVRRTVRHVGMLTARHGPRGPVAIVTTQAGLLRMTNVYSELGELTALDARAFATIAEAEAWLSAHEDRAHETHHHR
jgi:hypothetical protein